MAGIGCRVYVGNLNASANERDLEEAFRRYGTIKDIWVARRPPGFAFIEFEDPRDAEDSVKDFNGRDLMGQSVKVEISNRNNKERRSPPRSGRGYDRSRSPPRRRNRSRSPPRHRRDRSRSPGFRDHRESHARRSRHYSPVRKDSNSRRSRSVSQDRAPVDRKGGDDDVNQREMEEPQTRSNSKSVERLLTEDQRIESPIPATSE